MTTIAYRKGTMAADTRAYAGKSLPIGSKHKIEKLDDGTLIGVSTTQPGGAENVRRWYKEGCQKEVDYNLPDNFELLAVKANGEVYYGKDAYMITGPLEGEFFAIGSGQDFALGAMAGYHHAEKAIEIACLLDVWSSLPIDVLTLT